MVLIDTLKFAKRLREAGFSDPQAEAVIATVQAAVAGAELATKRDLDAAIAALRNELREVELRLAAKIAEVEL
jgi:CO dehydrogenase/acetyl-CoA synthase alpha subunit